MKRFLSAILQLFFLLHLSLSPAFAIDIYGFGSYWDMEDADGTWGAGLGVSLPLLTEHFRLDGRVYVLENSDLDDDDELDIVPFDFGAQIHLLPGSQWDPYALGGVSYIYADADRADVDSEFGAYIGAGLEYELATVIKPFAEVMYRKTELGSDIGPRNDDIDISGVTANLGLKIHF